MAETTRTEATPTSLSTPATPATLATLASLSTLAAEVRQHERPGDRIFVSELMRYPWALYEQRRLAVRFGPDWATGFTVISTDPAEFIAPSEYYEGGSDPKAWANAMRGARRVWYVYSPPLAVVNPSFAALRADGWRPVLRVEAQGCAAALLVRGSRVARGSRVTADRDPPGPARRSPPRRARRTGRGHR